MVTSKQLHRIATNPRDYVRFVSTGRLPRFVRPQSPLIDLLEQIAPRDRCAIRRLTVGVALGYTGSRTFDSAEQALNWVRPREEMLDGESWPAQSWLDRRFAKRLTLDDLLACAARFPEGIRDRYPRLK